MVDNQWVNVKTSKFLHIGDTVFFQKIGASPKFDASTGKKTKKQLQTQNIRVWITKESWDVDQGRVMGI